MSRGEGTNSEPTTDSKSCYELTKKNVKNPLTNSTKCAIIVNVKRG